MEKMTQYENSKTNNLYGLFVSNIIASPNNFIRWDSIGIQTSDMKDIFFYINSPGGSVYDALAIYDTMQYVTNDIQTVGIGIQASAAAFLLSSGTKGKRFILPHATVMIHQPSSGTRGKVTDQEIDLRESLRIKKLLEGIMAKNTGQTIERIHDDMERDKWLTAEEAKEYGIIDQIITTPPVQK